MSDQENIEKAVVEEKVIDRKEELRMPTATEIQEIKQPDPEPNVVEKTVTTEVTKTAEADSE